MKKIDETTIAGTEADWRSELDKKNAAIQRLERELQIEAALEQVRARTMAMQRSEELQDTAKVLFEQILSLGVPSSGCGFNIWDDDRQSATAWMAGTVEKLMPSFKTSSKEDIFLKIYEASERGESLFVKELSGKEIEDHNRYMMTYPIFKRIAEKLSEDGIPLYSFQIMHASFFSQGYLMFITTTPVPEFYDIFKRFAKVFEQTYTRFLDLQKAEAQAREAQIQASLEKVRSGSLAMHNSDELIEAGELLWHELRKLGIESLSSGYVVMDKDEKIGWTYAPNPANRKDS